MEEDSKLVFINIEGIIKFLKTQSKHTKNMRKFDGITIEAEVATADKRINAMNEMQALSKKYGIIPVAVEARADSDVLFGVQYPELRPVYSDEEVRKMYEDTFEFLLNNIKTKDPKSITRTILIENMERFTRHAIIVYCKSNINQYKETVDDYLNKSKYRTKINGWYLEYIDKYLSR